MELVGDRPHTIVGGRPAVAKTCLAALLAAGCRLRRRTGRPFGSCDRLAAVSAKRQHVAYGATAGLLGLPEFRGARLEVSSDIRTGPRGDPGCRGVHGLTERKPEMKTNPLTNLAIFAVVTVGFVVSATTAALHGELTRTIVFVALVLMFSLLSRMAYRRWRRNRPPLSQR